MRGLGVDGKAGDSVMTSFNTPVVEMIETGGMSAEYRPSIAPPRRASRLLEHSQNGNMDDHWRFLRNVRAFALPVYQRPERAYHDDWHVRNMLCALAAQGVLTPTLALAVWGHDLVYDPRKHDNEERSAEVFDNWLQTQDAPEELRKQIRTLILATRHTSPPYSHEEALLVDADLSILAAPAEEFQAYEEGIRQEYAHVPALLYRAGRRRVLQAFLNRERIYTTPEFSELEEQARRNLQASLRNLQ